MLPIAYGTGAVAKIKVPTLIGRLNGANPCKMKTTIEGNLAALLREFSDPSPDLAEVHVIHPLLRSY